MRTTLPTPGFLALFRRSTEPPQSAPTPDTRTLPTEKIPEDELRRMIHIGKVMQEKALRAEFARTGALYNSCPQCGAPLEELIVEGTPLLGCPNRTDAAHRTGEIPRISPVRARAEQEAQRHREKQLATFLKLRYSFLGLRSEPLPLAIESSTPQQEPQEQDKSALAQITLISAQPISDDTLEVPLIMHKKIQSRYPQQVEG